MVPMTTAPNAFMTAILTDSQAASMIWRFWNKATYHFNVGECAASQTVTSREALNEKPIIERIGRYKNAKPKASRLGTRIAGRRFTTHSPALGGCNAERSLLESATAAEWQSPRRWQPASRDFRRTHPTVPVRS